MTEQTAQALSADDTSIVIAREFDAPRDLVFQVWTQAEHVEKWFGPEGFSTRVEKLDFRPGGRSRYVMIGPDGNEYPAEGTFLEIIRPERIVTTDEFGDDFKGENLPAGMVLTATFDDLGDRTRVTLHIAHPTPEDRKKHEDMGVVDGWGTTLDCLERYLRELQEERE
jgi:uncharacterized protein YndB with AHSA1/START domain